MNLHPGENYSLKSLLLMMFRAEVWQTDFAVQQAPNIFTGGGNCYYIQPFINTHSRELVLGGITSSPHTEWMQQSARNISGFEIESADLLIRDHSHPIDVLRVH